MDTYFERNIILGFVVYLSSMMSFLTGLVQLNIKIVDG